MLDWLRRNAQRSPRLYTALRAVKRRLAPGHDLPPPPAPPRGRIEIKGEWPPFNVGGSSRLTAEVTNLTPEPWPGSGQVSLSYHWRRLDGSVWARDGCRVELPTVLPGASVAVELTVQSPNTPAPYSLELEFVSGADGWFGVQGSMRRAVVVGGMQPDALDEIDYEKAYAATDLNENYWGISGPASPAEFHELGRAKLRILQDLGLKPDSTVLDIGCGTGSLTEALDGFLGSEGLYFGTDLSEVAADFCRNKFARPNFLFAKNGMTTVPIDDRRFDYIVFFSVFTHTYPDETRALLGEAVRLLKDGGIILADVFEADIDGDSLGTRAMIVLDRRRMLGLAEAQGLEVQTISEYTWDPTGPRRIDRVLRRFARPAART